MTEATLIQCGRCGNKIPVVATPDWPETVTCSSCGQTYMKTAQNGSEHHSFDLGSLLGGLLIGTIFIGPFLWTGLGRMTAIEAIKRGSKATETQVKSWLKKGEGEG